MNASILYFGLNLAQKQMCIMSLCMYHIVQNITYGFPLHVGASCCDGTDGVWPRRRNGKYEPWDIWQQM